MNHVFETERLFARRWEASDAPDLFAIYSNTEVTRFLGDAGVSTIEEIHERMPRLLGTYERYGPGFGVWAAVRKTDRVVLGTVLLKALPGPDEAILTEDVEVGWHLRREMWGMGFATEIGAGALRHGFERQGLSRIHAVVDLGNHGSSAVAERLGMVLQGRTDAYYGGEVVDHYTLDRDTWANEARGATPG
ncbi:MAG: GNAT family N-acetyltransferase [Myxococcota bacterium]|nr:GNAT family N-acetyltransferase [Myxococcota bacterium]